MCVCVYVCVYVCVCVCVCEKLNFSEAADWDVEEILVRIEFYI